MFSLSLDLQKLSHKLVIRTYILPLLITSCDKNTPVTQKNTLILKNDCDWLCSKIVVFDFFKTYTRLPFIEFQLIQYFKFQIILRSQVLFKNLRKLILRWKFNIFNTWKIIYLYIICIFSAVNPNVKVIFSQTNKVKLCQCATTLQNLITVHSWISTLLFQIDKTRQRQWSAEKRGVK